MEIIHGCKYSKVTAPEAESEQEKVNVPIMRAWRSVKRLASRFMRRRRKLVAAVIVRRAVRWGSLRLQAKRKVCRITDVAKKKGNEEGLGSNMKYDILSYWKNFDDGGWQQEEVEFYSRRSFSYRFVQGNSLELDCL